MGKAPDEIRAEIEQTRAELSTDVDMLAEKVSPARVVERRVDATKAAVTDLKEKVMGKASDVTSAAGDKASGLTAGMSSATSSTGQTVSQAPQQVKSKAQGNPMAAGLVAFGMGWLASSLFPTTQTEQRLAESLKEKGKPLAEPVKSELSSVASELKDNLQQPVQEAVSSVKDTATDAAGTVKDTATSSTQDVKDHAEQAAGTVKDHATDSASTVKEQAGSSASTVKDAAAGSSGSSDYGSTATYPAYDDTLSTAAGEEDDAFTVPPSPYSSQGSEADLPGGGARY